MSHWHLSDGRVFQDLISCTVDESGNIYLLDNTLNRVQKYG
jgi:hypothetical protein